MRTSVTRDFPLLRAEKRKRVAVGIDTRGWELEERGNDDDDVT